MGRWWTRVVQVLTPWRNPVPPTVPWHGPITFRCQRCQTYHESGPCPPARPGAPPPG